MDAIQLLPKEKNFQLVLVGDGPEKKILKEKATTLGLGNKVIFTGRVTYETMQEYYKKADVFVFPSLRETTGTVLFEAMSNGLPIISFNQNGAQLLLDDSCGIRVNIDSSLADILKSFANAIEKMIDSPEKRKEMGNNAYKKIVSQYIWERKCELFFERYENIRGEQE